MADFIVTIDDKAHLLAEDETTVCGIVADPTTQWSREPQADPCPVCFPDLAPKPKAKAKK